jgi:NAD(P)-dependent dehydrogenase (short-subunit alcohol dehydrogenase family)
MDDGGTLEGRVAIVSGGARGIGEAHVRALAGEGAHVVIGDVLADEGASLAEQDGWGPGAVTILVNNAGIMMGQ